MSYERKRNSIKNLENGQVVAFKSINLAKKESRAIQSMGNCLKVVDKFTSTPKKTISSSLEVE